MAALVRGNLLRRWGCSVRDDIVVSREAPKTDECSARMRERKAGLMER